MRFFRNACLTLVWLLIVPALAGASPRVRGNSCRLILPLQIQAVVGREMNLYFDNVVLAASERGLLFDVTCDKGAQQEERWTFTPQAGDTGSHPLRLDVYDSANRLIASAETAVRVVPADAGAGREVTFLMIGDSLTHASVYPAEALALSQGPGNPKVTLVGTHSPLPGDPAVRHEGYGGWTFERFVTRYAPPAEGAEIRQRGSPFVFLEDKGAAFDFPRYVQEQCGGRAPDFVSIALGCNDIFGAKEEAAPQAVRNILGFADRLIAGIRAGGPGTRIGVIPPVPPAASQDAFGASYGCGQTRWQYRRNQHALVEAMQRRYGGREGEGIYLVPAYVSLDTVRGFPTRPGPASARMEDMVARQNDGVHPSAAGYRQMGDALYAWMKSLLAPER
ncbi:MAG: SGNH/GDSL hydrolase family protein [Armatimonadetes bacterium]|nr:SGNH/GDSL hydrolase family protein [Armatimonadota bacterium]